MTELTLIKSDVGIFPADAESKDFIDKKLKYGDRITCEFRRTRNAKFHRKGMALLNFLYEHWEPGEINNEYGTPEKNFDRFRKDLTILAGFYEQHIRVNGDIRVEAKSISFSSMDEDEFEAWYSAIIDVGLKYILKNYSKEELDKVVDELIGGFA